MSRAKVTAKKKALFLEKLSKGSTVTQASGEIDMPTRTLYDHRAADPEFAEAWDAAQEAAVDLLEAEARRRAVEGVDEPAGWFQGTPGGYVRKYSDTLLIFLLKGANPAKYRERVDVEHNPSGKPIPVEVTRVFVRPSERSDG